MRAKILNASAGSGKTFRLAYKYVHDTIADPSIYRNILAVTFTNKATEEMKSRILKEIHTLASGLPSPYMKDLREELGLSPEVIQSRAKEVRSKILHDYSRFTVLTIDTFFQRILRSFIKELDIDLNYNIELETDSILSKSTDALIEKITIDQELKDWLIAFAKEQIDDGKKWDIRSSILNLGKELFKESNKETLDKAQSRKNLKKIVDQVIAQSSASQNQLLSIAKQASELISGAGAGLADFKYGTGSGVAFFYKILKNDYRKGYGKRTVELIESDSAKPWCKAGSPAETLVPRLRELLAEACRHYDRDLSMWNTCDLLRQNYRSFALLTDLYTTVLEMCDQQNMMLLSETKYILSKFINESDVPFIYEKVGNRFKHFMIDEFQDTSVKEWENFLPLLQNAMAQCEEQSVLLVGDIKQSIYRWRGGDWRLLHQKAQEDLGKEDTHVENMIFNYRSYPAVVEFNNRAIAHVVATDNELLNAKLQKAAEEGHISRQEYARLKDTLKNAYLGHEQTPTKKTTNPGYVSVEDYEEETPLVECIHSLLDKGYRPCDIMVLVRTNTQSQQISEELLASKSTNPKYHFDVMTQVALVIGSAPVSTFIAATLRLTLNLSDRLSMAEYNHFLGYKFDRELTAEECDFLTSLRLYSPEEAFERIVIQYNLQEDKAQTAYLQAIHEQIIAFCSNKVADISLYLKWWDEQGSRHSLSIEQSASTIEITTVHKAKGLEKRAVIIPSCSWTLEPITSGLIPNIVWAEADKGALQQVGRIPIKYNLKMQNSDFSTEFYRELVYAHVDNVNLLYVALTRAVESLHIYIPKKTRDNNHVGTLLAQALSAMAQEDKNTPATNNEEEQTSDGASAQRFTVRDLSDAEHLKYEYGEFATPQHDADDDSSSSVILENYHTAHASLRLHLPSQRYFEEGASELSPRNFGILMHKAFQESSTEEEIFKAVDKMRCDGLICEEEEATLHAMIDRAMQQPLVKEWFSGKWDMVRNEHEIILPQGSSRRPDRVMLQGKEAVVVDYKFGDKKLPSYTRQIKDYLSLLRQMGYTSSKGYLWYVMLGEIVAID